MPDVIDRAVVDICQAEMDLREVKADVAAGRIQTEAGKDDSTLLRLAENNARGMRNGLQKLIGKAIEKRLP